MLSLTAATAIAFVPPAGWTHVASRTPAVSKRTPSVLNELHTMPTHLQAAFQDPAFGTLGSGWQAASNPDWSVHTLSLMMLVLMMGASAFLMSYNGVPLDSTV